MAAVADAAAAPGRQRGAFILLEGIDRCGKSTQAKRLVEHLNSSGVSEPVMSYSGPRCWLFKRKRWLASSPLPISAWC